MIKIYIIECINKYRLFLYLNIEINTYYHKGFSLICLSRILLC